MATKSRFGNCPNTALFQFYDVNAAVIECDLISTRVIDNVNSKRKLSKN